MPSHLWPLGGRWAVIFHHPPTQLHLTYIASGLHASRRVPLLYGSSTAVPSCPPVVRALARMHGWLPACCSPPAACFPHQHAGGFATSGCRERRQGRAQRLATSHSVSCTFNRSPPAPPPPRPAHPTPPCCRHTCLLLCTLNSPSSSSKLYKSTRSILEQVRWVWQGCAASAAHAGSGGVGCHAAAGAMAAYLLHCRRRQMHVHWLSFNTLFAELHMDSISSKLVTAPPPPESARHIGATCRHDGIPQLLQRGHIPAHTICSDLGKEEGGQSIPQRGHTAGVVGEQPLLQRALPHAMHMLNGAVHVTAGPCKA